MAIKTYRAKSPSEALALVKKDIGSDAVILHTRTYKTGGVMGLGARTITEITATTSSTAGATPAPRAGSRKRDQATDAPVPRRVHAPSLASDRAEMLRDALELSSGARARARAMPRPAPVDAKAEAKTETLVLEPDREPAPALETEAKADGQARAQAGDDHSARLEALYLERERATPTPAIVVEPKRPGGPPPAPGGTTPADVAGELAALKKMMGQVLRSSRGQSGALLPPSVTPIAEALEEAELEQELADRVIAGVLEELSSDELGDEAVVRQVALRRIAGLIPVDHAVARPEHAEGPLVIALVGPTGVGKTTTVAKLAATFKLRHGRSVGLVTSDTYRIAAVDQLRTYANIIGLPIKVTLTPSEMAQAVRGFESHDVVILDTAGRSQNDATRIDELRAFLDAADPTYTQLVLSSTSSAKVTGRIVDVFGALEPTHAIATKLDEGAALGPLVGAVRTLGVPFSFVTTGQEVPDQIETADAERFARRLLASAQYDGGQG